MSVSAASARRVALVTGGNKGIGFEIVRQLAAADPALTVLLGARDNARGEASVKSLAALPRPLTNISPLHLDVTSPASIAAAASTVKSRYGRLDLLVANAGVFLKHGADHSARGEDVDATFGVNYRGVRDCAAAFLPLMSPGARIVAVSSELAHPALAGMSPSVRSRFAKASTVGEVDALVDEYRAAAVSSPDKRKDSGWSTSHYGVSKVAVCAWGRALAKTLAASAQAGVTVHTACPGWCATDMSPGPRPAAEGAAMIVHVAQLAQEEAEKTNGEFWSNKKTTKVF